MIIIVRSTIHNRWEIIRNTIQYLYMNRTPSHLQHQQFKPSNMLRHNNGGCSAFLLTCTNTMRVTNHFLFDFPMGASPPPPLRSLHKRQINSFGANAPVRGGKKNASTWRRITDAREEQKRSRCKQSTLRIKDFKYGPSLSIFIRKK